MIMKLKEFQEAIRRINREYDDVHTSPDFQCDATEGFPTSLCCSFEKGLAWLEPNYNIDDDEHIAEAEEACAKFGFRFCSDVDEFNELLESLGEDAILTAKMYDDEDIGMGGM